MDVNEEERKKEFCAAQLPQHFRLSFFLLLNERETDMKAGLCARHDP
jgi:hypothetical protein